MPADSNTPPGISPLQLLMQLEPPDLARLTGAEPRQLTFFMEGGRPRFMEPPVRPTNTQPNASVPHPPGTPGSASPQDLPVTSLGVEIREIYPLLRLLQNLSGPRLAY